nr:uncharacterized protein LOC111417097 [Onthophagus taurus]
MDKENNENNQSEATGNDIKEDTVPASTPSGIKPQQENNVDSNLTNSKENESEPLHFQYVSKISTENISHSIKRMLKDINTSRLNLNVQFAAIRLKLHEATKQSTTIRVRVHELRAGISEIQSSLDEGHIDDKFMEIYKNIIDNLKNQHDEISEHLKEVTKRKDHLNEQLNNLVLLKKGVQEKLELLRVNLERVNLKECED